MKTINRQVLCIILGGGAGTRLYPLTARRSKPAVPVGGKYRLIDIPISNCLTSGLRRIFVLTQFNSASLNRHVKNTFQFDSFNDGFVDILAAEQTPMNKGWFQGTADAVRQSMHRLENFDYDYVLILSGDQLYQMDYSEMLKAHKDSGADVSIATIPVTDHDAPGFGIMKVDAENEINTFIEKPSLDVLHDWKSEVPEKFSNAGKHYLASMGIYLFNKSTLKKLFEQSPEEHDFGKGIIPAAITNENRVKSFSYDGYWTDIGTIRSFFEANLDLTNPVPQFNLYLEDHPIYTRSRMLAPTKLMGTRCDRASIAEGCIINADEITESVIGIRSRIGHGTKVHRAIVMGKDSYQDIEELERQNIIPMGVGNNCFIKNAIIDINARVGHDVTIIGDTSLDNTETDLYCIVDGIVAVKKGAVIPHGTKIGKVE